MSKKNFKKGIEDLLNTKIVSNEHKVEERKKVNTSIIIREDLYRKFNIELINKGIKKSIFFDTYITKLIDGVINPSDIDISKIGLSNEVEKKRKYSLVLFEDTKKKLDIYCANNNISLKNCIICIIVKCILE